MQVGKNCPLKKKAPRLQWSRGDDVKLRKTIRRMLSMCPEAWYFQMLSVKLTAFLLLCAFVLLLGWDGSMLHGYRQYMTAMSLYETGQVLTLIGAVLPVCIEELNERRR